MARTPRFSLLCSMLLASLAAPLAQAQNLILDAEFMHVSELLAAPLRPNLAPNTRVTYVLLADNTINAFVTGENVIHINSGIVLKAKSASELQGVIAHELGHIAAHHILQRQGNAEQATLTALAGAVLGVGAAAAGAPQAGMAVVLGSQAGALQGLLAHTRTQEAEADRHAINALHQAGLSAQGMVDMFSTLRTESQLSYDAPPPWLVTHPLPPERLATLQAIISKEDAALKSGLLQSEKTINFPRLQAKVMALTMPPNSVLRKYNDKSPLSMYARALAYLQQGKIDFAASSLAPLLKDNPNDPFYQELAAQIAIEKSDLGTANRLFLTIVNQYPSNVLFRYQLAEVQRNQMNFTEAQQNYERITRAWPNWAEPWRGLALTYGSLGRVPESHLAMAEYHLGAYNLPAAQQSLAVAQNYLKQTPNPVASQWAETLADRLKSKP